MKRIFIHGPMYSGEKMFAERLLEHLVFNQILLYDMINTMGFRHFKLNPTDDLSVLHDYSTIQEKIVTKTESLSNANFNGMLIRGLASSIQCEQLLNDYPDDRHFFFKRNETNASEQQLVKRAGNMVNVIPSLNVETIVKYNNDITETIGNLVSSKQLEWKPVLVKKTEITEELLPEVDNTNNAQIFFAVIN